jgi:hypothetical protein
MNFSVDTLPKGVGSWRVRPPASAADDVQPAVDKSTNKSSLQKPSRVVNQSSKKMMVSTLSVDIFLIK